MRPPEAFARRLAQEFDHRLRIRWSPYKEEWQLEQKVARAQSELPRAFMEGYAKLPAAKRFALHDLLTRSLDGYAFVAAIRLGEFAPCLSCGETLKVPRFGFAEVVCPACRAKGVDSSVKAGYWPLSDMLLDHLRKIDPERGGVERMAQEAEEANARRTATLDKDAQNLRRDIAWDVALGQLPKIGYTTSREYRASD